MPTKLVRPANKRRAKFFLEGITEANKSLEEGKVDSELPELLLEGNSQIEKGNKARTNLMPVTPKEMAVVEEYFRCGSKKEAVRRVYNPQGKSPSLLANFTNAIFNRPQVQQEIMRHRQEADLEVKFVIDNVKDALNYGRGVNAKHSDWLKALELAAKVSGLLDKKSFHARIDVTTKMKDVPYEKLLEEYEKTRRRADSLVREGEIIKEVEIEATSEPVSDSSAPSELLS